MLQYSPGGQIACSELAALALGGTLLFCTPQVCSLFSTRLPVVALLPLLQACRTRQERCCGADTASFALQTYIGLPCVCMSTLAMPALL